MTDAERSELERQLLAAWEEATGGIDDEVLRALGNPPDAARLEASFWTGLSATLAGGFRPVLEQILIGEAQAAYAANGLTIGVNWELVNTRAAQFAENYSFELVKGITENSEARLQRLVSNFFKTPGQDLKTLGSEIGKIFGPVRGEMIATTEVTRAVAEGDGLLMREIRRLDPRARMAEYWQTSNDRDVDDEICAPLEGVRGDGGGNFVHPQTGVSYRVPAHPRCRCVRRVQIVS